MIENLKDIEISWPSDDAVRLANAILHTYQVSEYNDTEFEIPIETICKLFKKAYNAESSAYISELVNEILDEPVAVMNKEMDHKLIEWETYTFFKLLEPLETSDGLIKLDINLEYIKITKEFVVNPYLEF